MAELWDQLTALEESDNYPFHMPGHKRRKEASILTSELFGHDITEIDGFDNLHDAEDILLRCQKRANALYKADETFFLVNGSSCGVLAAISSVTSDGDCVLAGRNSHKSLYHAAYLKRLDLSYLYPDWVEEAGLYGAVSPEEVEKGFQRTPDVKAVFITSPTYEGIYSDIQQIAEIAHGHGVPLIVDEAHGAHLGLDETLPSGALMQGADIVIHSVHKTLPSVTQTALLHIQGSLIDRSRLQRFLRIYQSSSPSYLLMASIDECMAYMEKSGTAWAECLNSFHDAIVSETKGCKRLQIFGRERIPDPCKIVISCKNAGIAGQVLYDLLRDKYRLQPEMAGETYVLMIITGSDSKEGIARLIDAVLELDVFLQKEDNAVKEDAYSKSKGLAEPESKEETNAVVECPLWKAWDADTEMVDLSSSKGRIAGDFVNLYPPGIPMIVPGEKITDDRIAEIKEDLARGLNVQGVRMNQVSVLRDASKS